MWFEASCAFHKPNIYVGLGGLRHVCVLHLFMSSLSLSSLCPGCGGSVYMDTLARSNKQLMGNDNVTMQNLNDCLASYLDKVYVQKQTGKDLKLVP